MSDLTPAHDMFTIVRRYKSPPAKVFAAWSTAQGKASWFAGGEGWTEQLREFDFRVGGQDRLVGRWQNAFTSDYRATYHDIAPNQRIITAYDMRLDGKLISVSLATVTFEAEGEGARLTMVEQGVFVDGYQDNGGREQGTNVLLDRLGAYLEGRAMESFRP